MLTRFYLGIPSKTLEQITSRAMQLQTKLALSKEHREMWRPNWTDRNKKKKPKQKNGRCGYLSCQAWGLTPRAIPRAQSPSQNPARGPHWAMGGTQQQPSSLFTVHPQVARPAWSLSREHRTAQHQQILLPLARVGLRAGLAPGAVLLLEDAHYDSTDSSSQHLSSAKCQPGYPLSARSHFHSYPSSPHCSQPSLFSDGYCNCHFLNPTI